MTGALLYNFGYDARGLLITVTDGSGNVTTIQRDTNEYPTAIVSPYGQTTTLNVDANGYLSQVTDPMGNSVKLTSTTLGLLKAETTGRGESRPRSGQFRILILLGQRNVIHDQPNPCLTGQKAPNPLQKHGET
jgi:YD repeat-containing protein